MSQESGPYSTYEGSPISKGEFQFDMWGVNQVEISDTVTLDWDSLRQQIKEHGVRNSLLLAL